MAARDIGLVLRLWLICKVVQTDSLRNARDFAVADVEACCDGATVSQCVLAWFVRGTAALFEQNMKLGLGSVGVR